jgi:hypothetical protein
MAGNKYYLVRKSSTAANANFYLRDNATTEFADKSDALVPIIENCVRMEFSYANTNSGAVVFTNTWASQTNLPAGVLVSVWVLDSRAAEKFSSESPDDLTNRAVRMRRFIPLNPH